MSTDWGIGCRTCAAKWRGSGDDRWEHREKFFTGEFDNCRRVDALYRLIAGRRAIALLAGAGVGDLVSVHWNEGWWSERAHGVVEFFAEHAEHDLEPMSEYLEFDSEPAHYQPEVAVTDEQVGSWNAAWEARRVTDLLGLPYAEADKVRPFLHVAHEVGRRRGRMSR